MLFEVLSLYFESVTAFWVAFAGGGFLKVLLMWMLIYWIFCRPRRWRRRWGRRRMRHMWMWGCGPWGCGCGSGCSCGCAKKSGCACGCTCGGCGCGCTCGDMPPEMDDMSCGPDCGCHSVHEKEPPAAESDAADAHADAEDAS